jgi:hypothetical protein
MARVPRTVGEDESRPGAHWLALAMISCASLLIGVSRTYLAWHSSSYYHLGFLLLTRTISWFAMLYLAVGVVALFSRRLDPAPA